MLELPLASAMTGATSIRRRRTSLLAIAALTALAAADARARPRRGVKVAARAGNAKTGDPKSAAPARATNGPAVVFVTEKRAYLNRGARDGLTANQSVPLFRVGRAAGSCTIETLAERQASCKGGRPRVGDSFRVPGAAADRRRAAPPALPPVEADETLRARATVIADSRYDQVDFNGARVLGDHTHAQLAPGVVVWHTQPDPNGDSTLVEIDGEVHVYDVAGTGARFDAAFSALRWGGQAADGRFRPGAQSQFYLWEAELSKRRTDGQTVFALGRIWPWHLPGLAMIDGMQIGRRNKAETVEGGVYAGLMPTALDVLPTSSAWAAGAYGAFVQIGSNKQLFRLVREEARVGLSSAPETGQVADVEALAQAFLGAWNVAAGGRVLRSSLLAPQPELDRATIDVGARPTLAFGLGLHLRYFSGVLPVAAPLVAVTPATGLTSASGDVHWDPTGWLGVSLLAGGYRDKQSTLTEAYVAAELRLPRLLGGAGGLTGGVEADEGWLRSELVYGQLVTRFGERLRLLARASMSANEFTTPALSPNIYELGGYLHLDGALATWLRLRAWSILRVPILVQGELPGEATFGASGGLSLTGAF
jgi:hypothetical protein